MYRNITTLFDNRVKKYWIITAAMVFIVDILTHYRGDFYISCYFYQVFFHYIVLVSLAVAVQCKDKIDDELSRQVRYSIFKNTLSFTIIILAILVLFLTSSGIEKISTIVIIYILEGILILHLILYHIGHRYSPKWLLSEETAPERFNKMMITFLVLFLVFVTILLILSFIIKFTGEL
ncbi:MAG: hypothetical protein JW894_05265 [Bacteroidales bacterium]|nr:hypothetical protein [Bacteroidales bacterium]